MIDVLSALHRMDGAATAKEVASELGTSLEDVIPQLITTQRRGLTDTARRPDRQTEFALLAEGEALI
jgi:hypothetical protein